MKKYKSLNLIQILSVILLINVCIAFIGTTNAWFTTSGYNIMLDVQIGAINMKVLQDSTELDSENSSYITLNKEILPDEQNELNLNLKNKESAGCEGYYVRYKIEFYASNTILTDAEIVGFAEQSSSLAGFVKDGDWFYYKNTAGDMEKYSGGTNLSMMTGFIIPYSSFVTDGNFVLNADCLKIKVVVQGSTTGTFEEVV